MVRWGCLSRGAGLAAYSWIVLAALLAMPLAVWRGPFHSPPIADSYGEGFVAVVTLNLGPARTFDRMVWNVVGQAAGQTLRLVLLSVMVAVVLSAPTVGLARRADDRVRSWLASIGLLGVSVPAFAWLYVLGRLSPSLESYGAPPDSAGVAAGMVSTLPGAFALGVPLAAACAWVVATTERPLAAVAARWHYAWLAGVIWLASLVAVEYQFGYVGVGYLANRAVIQLDSAVFAGSALVLAVPALLVLPVRAWLRAAWRDAEPATTDGGTGIVGMASGSRIGIVLGTLAVCGALVAAVMEPASSFPENPPTTWQTLNGLRNMLVAGLAGITIGGLGAAATVTATRRLGGWMLPQWVVEPTWTVPLVVHLVVGLSFVYTWGNPLESRLPVIGGLALGVALIPFLAREVGTRTGLGSGGTVVSEMRTPVLVGTAGALLAAASLGSTELWLSEASRVFSGRWRDSPPLAATLLATVPPVLATLLLAAATSRD